MLKAGENLPLNYALDTENWRAAAHCHPSATTPLKLLEFLCCKQVHLELDANMYPQYGKHTFPCSEVNLRVFLLSKLLKLI